MTVLAFIVFIVILGIVFYMVERFVPMSPPFKTGLRIAAILILVALFVSLVAPLLGAGHVLKLY